MAAYVSVEELKEYLGITKVDPDLDNFLQDQISRAQKMIESATQRIFIADTDTTRTFSDHDCISSDHREIYLDHDLCAITSVLNGDDEVVPLSSIITYPRNSSPFSELHIDKTADIRFAYQEDTTKTVRITGRWAYGLEVPEDIKQATIRLSAYIYRQRDNAQDLERTIVIGGQVLLPPDLPSDIKTILMPYLTLI